MIYPVKTAVLVSGGGTNLQALIDAQASAGVNADGTSKNEYEIAVVVSNTKDAFALRRAEAAGIPAFTASPVSVLGQEKAKSAGRDEKRFAVSDRISEICRAHNVEIIILAGFLTVLGGKILQEYSGRILNLHPALLPEFGGEGMWGHHVHEAVLAAGRKESGCTVHLVDAGCDTGKIILQKKVPVLPDDTPESLYSRIAPVEHEAMVEGARILARSVGRNR
ncbi:MAG: phosphoribosylglycinamide formyltransferase [Bacteroides sp.]|nr:phosphoribosylglycinamide formyltransferase [Prevotella sp.]MCM1406900.1 phosphoribosylglycinamide formyltransferase [Treponema brennaborense]MCM1470051.1 phosphoribosylglycinamide formyltransferase [Bacteroides sp.]